MLTHAELARHWRRRMPRRIRATVIQRRIAAADIPPPRPTENSPPAP